MISSTLLLSPSVTWFLLFTLSVAESVYKHSDNLDHFFTDRTTK